jgi:copper chaperone CopZ
VKTVVIVYAKLKGVAEASFDKDLGTLTVAYDSKRISEAQLLAALKDKPEHVVTKAEKPAVSK